MTDSTADNPVQDANALAQIYARSLFELAEQEGDTTLDAVGQELSDLVSLIEREPGLRELFESRSIKPDRRARSVEAIFRERVSGLMYRFLQVLNRKDRLDQLEGIDVAFRQKLKDKRGEVDVEAFTAQPMSDEQTRLVAEGVGRAIGKTALIHARVDASLIGGLKLRIGDRQIDGSVATQLKRMNRRLKQRGRENVRQRLEQMLAE